MEIKGYISSTEESKYAFYFEINKQTYFVPHLGNDINLIEKLRDSSLLFMPVSVEFEEGDFLGQKAIRLIDVRELSDSEKSLLNKSKSCSFCEHIYIRSKEHRYVDDCIVWVDDDECDPPMFKLYMSGAYMPIGYCPMCGRKLKDIQSE